MGRSRGVPPRHPGETGALSGASFRLHEDPMHGYRDAIDAHKERHAMKKMMFSLVGILLLIGALPAALSAQTGSPPASFTGQANGGEPVIGEPVTYVDASGNPAATIVVEEVERVW